MGIFLSYLSAHPKSILLSVAENELRRAIRRSNTDEGVKRGLKKISDLLRENDSSKQSFLPGEDSSTPQHQCHMSRVFSLPCKYIP